MMTTTQRRAHPRINCEVPIVVKKNESHLLHTAVLKNYSDAGIYFESFLVLKKGTVIQVRADEDSVLDPVSSGSWNSRRAEVRWCRALDDGTSALYGCGVVYHDDQCDC